MPPVPKGFEDVALEGEPPLGVPGELLPQAARTAAAGGNASPASAALRSSSLRLSRSSRDRRAGGGGGGVRGRRFGGGGGRPGGGPAGVVRAPEAGPGGPPHRARCPSDACLGVHRRPGAPRARVGGGAPAHDRGARNVWAT